jgi:trans-aconitate methyltransferase
MHEQTWDPDRYAKNARFVADLGAPLIDLLAPKAGERILDLGCGDGALTEKLVACGCTVVGVDGSAEQVAAARKRGLDARVMKGEALGFDHEFDAVFSNAALHWMKRADAVIDGVRRALKPGGRFVAEMGGAGCVAKVRAALTAALARRGISAGLLDPWYFPTAEDYYGRLQAHGFSIDSIKLFDRPTELPGSLTAWLETFGEPFTSALPPGERDDLRRQVEDGLRPALCGADGIWRADYVRLRFAARLASS